MDSQTTPIYAQDLADIARVAQSVPHHNSYSMIYGGGRTPGFEIRYTLSGAQFSAIAEHRDLFVAACLAASAALKHITSSGACESDR